MNRDFRNHTNDNWTIIENALNTLEKLGKEDKEELLARIDNLIINSGESNAEVADARLDVEGNNHTVLKKRLDSDQQKTAAQIESVTQDISGVKTSITNMSDPLSYLNSVDILCRLPSKLTVGNRILWLQGFNINAEKQEIYANFQDETLMQIEILDFNGNSKANKSIPIAVNSYTESLPYFYNSSNELNFIVRTKPDSTYNIYNFAKGTLSVGYQLKGRRTLAVRDGDYLLTCEEATDNSHNITSLYVYTWDSIIKGTPNLVGTRNLQLFGNSIEKVQGFVQNKGFTFLCQGDWKGLPYLTVYNGAGEVVNTFKYSKASLAKVINNKYPGAVTDEKGFEYESEGGCTYNGKLVTAQVADGYAYLLVHNTANGYSLDLDVPLSQIRNEKFAAMYFYRPTNKTYETGKWIIEHDYTPRWQQGTGIVNNGGIFEATEDGMYTIEVFLSVLSKQADGEHIISVDFLKDDGTVSASLELDARCNAYTNRYARLNGQLTWFIEKGTRFKLIYDNRDAQSTTAYETRVTITKL